MPEEPTEPATTPDVRTIRHLVRLMQRYDLTAIDLGEGPTKIRLRRRGAEPAPVAAAPAPAAVPSPTPAPPPPAADAAPATKAPAGVMITSPMVGTFYAAGAPDAAPFVTVGSVVNEKTIVGVIEAMKVFTEIPAEVSGRIAEVLVKNGQPVEFNQPLFRVSQA
jgi:acetyl-CoA carboxylase biotin carboxyl carrier protein